MNDNACLTEQDLILHYYGELPAIKQAAEHLAGCSRCQQRLATLQTDLARLPKLDLEPDPSVGIRLAARVLDKLPQRQRWRWLPAAALSATALVALVVTISNWSPKPEQPLVGTPLASLELEEGLPLIDFLEDMDVLQELELLREIEGV